MRHERRVPVPRIVIGVSACLLGYAVRYDGGHRLNAPVARLARHFHLIPVCPEAAAGLGVPRPPIRLTGHPRHARAVGVDDPARDVTGGLVRVARDAVRRHRYSGFVLKARSPSCGLAAPVLIAPGIETPGPGVFARTVRGLVPGIPCIEDDDLARPWRRARFITRVRAFHRQRATPSSSRTRTR